MKIWKPLLILNLCFSTLTCFAANRDDGFDRGNGGDEYAKSFIDMGLDIAESLAQHPLPGVKAEELVEAIHKTLVNSQEQLVLRGDEVDAINDPSMSPPRILISRKSWDRMEAAPHRRAFLVLHEYLGIMGIDDSRYQISRLLDRAEVCDRHPVIRSSIEQSLKKSCFRIIADDLKYISNVGAQNSEALALRKSDFAGMPNLDTLSFYFLEGFSISADLFDLTPRLSQLTVADTWTDLNDCSFFTKLPLLKRVTLSYGGDFERKLLKNIQENCFASLKKLESLSLAIEAKNSAALRFLSELDKNESLKGLYITGTELNQLDAQNFSRLPKALRSLSLSNQNGAFSDSFVKELQTLLGKSFFCSHSNSITDPKNGMAQLGCTKQQ
jgi:hypothetical protein